MGIEDISIDELLFDRQESFNDLVALIIAEITGVGDRKRMETNLNIINKIKDECDRRGFDPAQYDQVCRAKNSN